MPKQILIILIVAGTIILIAAILFIIFITVFAPKTPKAISDVSINYKIGSWPNQEALKVNELNTDILSDNLNLFIHKALIQYNITGTLKNKQEWKPYIKSVFISERWIPSVENEAGKKAEVLIIPIVAVKKDKHYMGEKIEFNVSVQDFLHTGTWGNNIYTIISQNQTKTIVLKQLK